MGHRGRGGMTLHEMIKDFSVKLSERAYHEGWAADSVKVTVEIGDWKAVIESTYVEIPASIVGAAV
jgi:hypothetical protein